jgi:hypothetical protein
MKFLYLFFSIFLLTLPAHAQAPDWQWMFSAGYAYDNTTAGVATDASGNVFCTGIFSGSAIFGTDTFTNGGTQDIFLAKFDKQGKLLWARRSYGDPSLNEAHAVCTDPSGNVYIGGYFYSNHITFGGATLYNIDSSVTQTSMFVVKYDGGGNVIWAKTASTHNSLSMANALVTDTAGNLFVTGQYTGGAFSSNGLPFISANYSLFTIKYSSAGSVMWAKSASADGDAFVNGIAIDNAGNVAIAGSYRYGHITFGSTTIIDPSALQAIYIASYDGNTGALRWAKGAGGTGGDYDYGSGVAADRSGNFFLTGYFRSSYIQFGTTSLTNPAPGNACIFVAKYNNSGIPVWAKSAGGTGGDDFSNCVATDADGSCYIGGTLSSSSVAFGTTILPSGAFITRYDPSGGVTWAKNSDFSGNVTTVAADNCGNGYIGGALQAGLPSSSEYIRKLGYLATSFTQAVCYGDNNGSATVSVVSGGAPPYTYLWSNGGTTATISGIGVGVYTVTVTQANGCSDLVTDTVTSKSNITTYFGATNVSCSGPCTGTGTVNAGGGIAPYSYLWDANAGNQTSSTATGLCPRAYGVKITDALGCVKQDTVKVYPASTTSGPASIVNIASLDQATIDPAISLLYQYDLPATITTNSSNPGNYLDAGKPVRIKAKAANNKPDGTAITSAQCVARTNSTLLTVTDSIAAFNTLSKNDTEWSNDELEFRVDAATPAGTNTYFDLVILDNGNEYATKCIALPMMPLVYSAKHQPVTDNDTGNCRGNGNGFCEPGEIISFAPQLKNVSNQRINNVRGWLENSDSLDYITIWNDHPGVAGNVTDSAWWNFTGSPGQINAGSTNVPIQHGFIFAYRHLSLIHTFKLYNIMEGSFKLLRSQQYSLFRWTLGYEFNDPTLGFMEITPENTVNVYPNPTDGNFFIQLSAHSGPVTISVMDVTGRSIASNVYTGNLVRLNLDLKDGIYFVRITNRETSESITRKVVVQR